MSRYRWGVIALGLLVVGTTGCGLKSSLEMPEKSTNIVIRGPQQPPGGGPAAPAEAPPDTTQPAEPAETPAVPAPKDDRLPPPPLPGSGRGG